MQFPFFAALIASILHVLAGPDHLAAVTPFAIESKRRAWKVGLYWGLGHLAGMICIGILFYFFREFIPIEKISEFSEQLVGFVLIVIGFVSVYKIFYEKKNHKHLHLHTQDPMIHGHEHQHKRGADHHHIHNNVQKQSHLTSFWIGVLHGLAGIAHFILFLPVLAFENQLDAIEYLLGFAIGILVAMVTYAFVLGRVSMLTKTDHNDLFFNGIRLSGGLFAIIIGLYWIFYAA